jgi:hypothetical protein
MNVSTFWHWIAIPVSGLVFHNRDVGIRVSLSLTGVNVGELCNCSIVYRAVIIYGFSVNSSFCGFSNLKYCARYLHHLDAAMWVHDRIGGLI